VRKPIDRRHRPFFRHGLVEGGGLESRFAQGLQPGCRCLAMVARWSPGEPDSSAASELRAKYCCTMCHKYCRIPCKLTAAEFRQMEQAMTEATMKSPEAEDRDEPS
jgi:hypothetical protein